MFEVFKNGGKINRCKIKEKVYHLKSITADQQAILKQIENSFYNDFNNIKPFLDFIFIENVDELFKECLEDEELAAEIIETICQMYDINKGASYEITKVFEKINSEINNTTFIIKKILIQYGYKLTEVKHMSQLELIEILFEEAALRSFDELFVRLEQINVYAQNEEISQMIEAMKQQKNKIEFENKITNGNAKTGVSGLMDL